jgi:hypothetical protein
MQDWRFRLLGITCIPTWLSGFKIEQFFTQTASKIAKVHTRRVEMEREVRVAIKQVFSVLD